MAFQDSEDIPFENFNSFSIYKTISFDGWALGLGYDYSEANIEHVERQVGPLSSNSGDARTREGYVSGSLFTLWYEMEAPLKKAGWLRFHQIGLGLNLIDYEELHLPDGRDNESSGHEIVPDVLAGIRYRSSAKWVAELAIRGNYHLTDWHINDQDTGRTADIDDYFAYGVSIGIGITL
jgi:hypothetical protein